MNDIIVMLPVSTKEADVVRRALDALERSVDEALEALDSGDDELREVVLLLLERKRHARAVQHRLSEATRQATGSYS